MRAGLIGHNVGNDSAFQQLPMYFCCITEQRDGLGFFCFDCCLGLYDRIVEIPCCDIDLFELQPTLNSPGIDLDKNADAAIESHRLRLSSSHLAKSRGQNQFPGKVSPTMLPCQ